MSKIWNVSIISSQYVGTEMYHRVDDMGTFVTKTEAVSFANRYLMDVNHSIVTISLEDENLITFRFGNSVLTVESIYT